MLNQNSNKKRKFTFNVIDALIIVVLVAIILTIVYTLVLGKDFEDLSSTKEDITYTVSIKGAPSDVLDKILVGDSVFHSDSEKNIGKVVSIEKTELENNTGYDLVITISVTARNKQGYYYVNKESLTKGANINIKFLRYKPDLVECTGVVGK